jgi:hypothetical protein
MGTFSLSAIRAVAQTVLPETSRRQSGGAQAYPRTGDSRVVWLLARLGRFPKFLTETVTDLQDRGIGEVKASNQHQ